MGNANDQELRLSLVKEKTTANTVAFKELDTGSGSMMLGRLGLLYVDKKALARIGNPEMITVVIRAGVGQE